MYSTVKYDLCITTGRCVFVMMREITTRWLVRYPAWIYVGRVSINDPLSVNRSTNESQIGSQFPVEFFETLRNSGNDSDIFAHWPI